MVIPAWRIPENVGALFMAVEGGRFEPAVQAGPEFFEDLVKTAIKRFRRMGLINGAIFNSSHDGRVCFF